MNAWSSAEPGSDTLRPRFAQPPQLTDYYLCRIGLPRYPTRAQAPAQWVRDMATCEAIVTANERMAERRFMASVMGAKME